MLFRADPASRIAGLVPSEKQVAIREGKTQPAPRMARLTEWLPGLWLLAGGGSVGSLSAATLMV